MVGRKRTGDLLQQGESGWVEQGEMLDTPTGFQQRSLWKGRIKRTIATLWSPQN